MNPFSVPKFFIALRKTAIMVIFIDMDDVLADTYGKHIELYNQEYSQNLTKDEFNGGEVWQNVPEEHQDSIHRHVHEPGFFRSLDPIPGSIDVVEALSKKHEVYIASAAMQFPNSLLEKSEWLDEFMPFIDWQHRILCGHKYILRGDLLIDDRAYNLEKFKGETLLFTSPHNIHVNGYDRVFNWEEVAERLL